MGGGWILGVRKCFLVVQRTWLCFQQISGIKKNDEMTHMTPLSRKTTREKPVMREVFCYFLWYEGSHKANINIQRSWTNLPHPYTCCKQQHIVHVFIWSLDSVNSYLGKVLITCKERCVLLNGMNPVLHLWIVFNNIEGGMWNGIAVFHTLEKMELYQL